MYREYRSYPRRLDKVSTDVYTDVGTSAAAEMSVGNEVKATRCRYARGHGRSKVRTQAASVRPL